MPDGRPEYHYFSWSREEPGLAVIKVPVEQVFSVEIDDEVLTQAAIDGQD
jgi:hypothetical protein